MAPAEQTWIPSSPNQVPQLHPTGSFLFGVVGFSLYIGLLGWADRDLTPGLGTAIFEGAIVGIPVLIGLLAVFYLTLTGGRPDAFIGWMALGTVTGIAIGWVAAAVSVTTYMSLHMGALLLFALLFIGVPSFMIALYSWWPVLRGRHDLR